MIQFEVVNIEFALIAKGVIRVWIRDLILAEKKKMGNIVFVFCDDVYLLDLNQKYLSHDTLTDVITFDYTDESKISGDIFISVERVNENALKFSISFEQELYRILAHGILHLCGYADKSKTEKLRMTAKENFYLEKLNRMFHVEQPNKK